MIACSLSPQQNTCKQRQNSGNKRESGLWIKQARAIHCCRGTEVFVKCACRCMHGAKHIVPRVNTDGVRLVLACGVATDDWKVRTHLQSLITAFSAVLTDVQSNNCSARKFHADRYSVCILQVGHIWVTKKALAHTRNSKPASTITTKCSSSFKGRHWLCNTFKQEATATAKRSLQHTPAGLPLPALPMENKLCRNTQPLGLNSTFPARGSP